jgi:hypothetical protein
MKTQGWDEFWYLHPADPMIRLAWFVYGCIEREQLMTTKAVAAHFAPYGLGWDGRLHAEVPRATAAAATATEAAGAPRPVRGA